MPWYNLSPYMTTERKIRKVEKRGGPMGKRPKVATETNIEFKVKRLRNPSPDIEEVIHPELGVYRINAKTKKRAIEVALHFYKQYQRKKIQEAIEAQMKEQGESKDEKRSEDDDSSGK